MTHQALFDDAIFDGDIMFDTGARPDTEIPTTIVRAVTNITTIKRVDSGNTTVLRAVEDTSTVKQVDQL